MDQTLPPGVATPYCLRAPGGAGYVPAFPCRSPVGPGLQFFCKAGYHEMTGALVDAKMQPGLNVQDISWFCFLLQKALSRLRTPLRVIRDEGVVVLFREGAGNLRLSARICSVRSVPLTVADGRRMLQVVLRDLQGPLKIQVVKYV